MSLTERSGRVLAEVDAGRMTHNVQIELIALVRAYHAQSRDAVLPDSAAPISIQVPAKAPEPSKPEGE